MKLFKNIAITLIALLFSCASVFAQATWTKVTNINQISDDGIYLLSAFQTIYGSTGKGNLYLLDRNISNSSSSVNCTHYQQNEKYITIPGTITKAKISENLIVKIYNKGNGHYNIYDIFNNKYFNGKQYLHFDSDCSSDDNIWSISITSDNAIIKSIDNGILFSTPSSNTINLYDKISDKRYYPTLYKLDHTTLSATTDYTEDVELSGVNVTFSRAFVDNVYNSIILPFGVENYKGVFGANVDAYVISDCTDGKINFNKSANNYLEANTPYLLYGAFSAGPYNFDNVTMQKASEAKNMTSSVYTFTGNYTKQNLGTKTGYYIINNNKLYDCGKLTALNITPHLCFITSSSNNNGTAKMSFDGIVTTGIDNISNGEKADGDIYNLSGIKSKTEKGFYIKSGKIHFKK